MLFNSVPGWADQIIGGWQVSSVIRYRSGLPTTVGGDLAYNANYWLNSLAIETEPVQAGVQIDQNGFPAFRQHSAASAFEDEFLVIAARGRAPAGAFLQHGPHARQIFPAAMGEPTRTVPRGGVQRIQQREFLQSEPVVETPNLTFGEFQAVMPIRAPCSSRCVTSFNRSLWSRLGNGCKRAQGLLSRARSKRFTNFLPASAGRVI